MIFEVISGHLLYDGSFIKKYADDDDLYLILCYFCLPALCEYVREVRVFLMRLFSYIGISRELET